MKFSLDREDYYRIMDAEGGVRKLNDSGLSAAQIEQLRLAAQAGVPENEVLKMAKGKKNTDLSKNNFK